MAVDSSHSNAEPEAVSFAAPRGRFIPFGIPFGSATVRREPPRVASHHQASHRATRAPVGVHTTPCLFTPST